MREYFEGRAHGAGVLVEDEADFVPRRDSDDEKEETEQQQEDGNNGSIGSADSADCPPVAKRQKLSSSGGGIRALGSNAGSSKGGKGGGKRTRVDADALKVARAMGVMVADMHNVNIVHGDLTTSELVSRILVLTIRYALFFKSYTPSCSVHDAQCCISGSRLCVMERWLNPYLPES